MATYSFQNQKLIHAYFKQLEENVCKKLVAMRKKITTQDIIQTIFKLLPDRNEDLRANVRAIMSENQETIVDQRQQINYLKRKAEIENELTRSFLKSFTKSKNKTCFPISSPKKIKKHSEEAREQLGLNLPLSRCQDSKEEQSNHRKSPICDFFLKEADNEESRIGQCATSRSKVSMSRYKQSQFAQEMEPDENEKIKALKKLRKLEHYVFQKQNYCRRSSKVDNYWNCGISPSKKRFEEQNCNLKAIQSNLVTHISLLQKFRDIPSIEGLVSRQENLKKKQIILKELSETLTKKQIQLNKKHTQFLKQQRSQKVL